MRSRSQNVSVGRKSQAVGASFESWIDGQHEHAHRLGILACVEKTEPHSRVSGGRVEFARPGVADYVGTLTGLGRTLAVEAKSTCDDRLYRSIVKPRQAQHLDSVAAAGGLALLLVEFRLTVAPLYRRFAVPWRVVPWSVARSAESVSADDLLTWLIAPDTCYLAQYHPGGPVVGSVGRKRVYPRE